MLQDLRFGLRNLLRSPGLALAAILTLALGIGANSSLFSVVNSVLLRPLPYSDPEPLVMVWEHLTTRDRPRNVVAPADYLDWRSRNTVFSEMAAISALGRTSLTGRGEPEQLRAEFTTASYWPLLGVKPIAGRVFTGTDDRPGAATVAIISHSLWMRKFGGDPGVIGSTATVGGEPATLIGVLPPDFQALSGPVDIWAPLRLNPARDYRKGAGRYLLTAARLKPGVTLERAQNEMRQIARELEAQYPAFNKNWSVNVIPLREQVVGDVRTPLLVLMGAVGFVLLIACANVANLLLARATGRRREMAIRSSLGATRYRIVRQMITESVLLAASGAALGWLLGWWSLQAIRNLGDELLPRAHEVGLDFNTLLFTTLIALASALLFGLAPALDLSGTRLLGNLQDGGRSGIAGRHTARLRSVLVVGQVALSVVLLTGAGLLIQSFSKLLSVNPGFDSENLTTLQVNLQAERYREPARRVSFFLNVAESMRQVPGVDSAAYVMFLPFTGAGSATSFYRADRPVPEAGQFPGTDVRIAHPDYFRTMRIPLLRGRTFDAGDLQPGAPMRFIVNEAMVRAMFPSEDPLTRRLIVSMGDDSPGEIVGVVGDVKHASLQDPVRPMVYYPHSRLGMSFTTFVVRSTRPSGQLVPELLRVLRNHDPELPAYNIQTMDEWLSAARARPRLQALLLAALAALAFILAAVGIYGVMAFLVAQRRQEIGVRMALGASRGQVLGMILGKGITLALAGLICGSAAAPLLTRALQTMLFQVTTTDPATYLTVAALLLAVAMAACWLPARQAATIDPAIALRNE